MLLFTLTILPMLPHFSHTIYLYVSLAYNLIHCCHIVRYVHFLHRTEEVMPDPNRHFLCFESLVLHGIPEAELGDPLMTVILQYILSKICMQLLLLGTLPRVSSTSPYLCRKKIMSNTKRRQLFLYH